MNGTSKVPLLSPSGSSDFLQIKLDEGRHLRRLPICLFGFFRPCERQMPNLSRCLRLFKHLKSFQKNFPLTCHVSDLPHGSTVRKFNGGRSGNAYGSMKFIGGRENHGRESILLQVPCSQSDGLATEGSGRCHENCLDTFNMHPLGYGLNRFY